MHKSKRLTTIAAQFQAPMVSCHDPDTSCVYIPGRISSSHRKINPPSVVSMDNSTLKQRATDILQFTNSLSDNLTALGLPEPSFERGLPVVLKSDAPISPAGTARQELLQSLDEFRALLTEPTLLLTPELASHSTSCLLKILTMTGVAQPVNQRALHRPPRYCREFPS